LFVLAFAPLLSDTFSFDTVDSKAHRPFFLSSTRDFLSVFFPYSELDPLLSLSSLALNDFRSSRARVPFLGGIDIMIHSLVLVAIRAFTVLSVRLQTIYCPRLFPSYCPIAQIPFPWLLLHLLLFFSSYLVAGVSRSYLPLWSFASCLINALLCQAAFHCLPRELAHATIPRFH